CKILEYPSVLSLIYIGKFNCILQNLSTPQGNKGAQINGPLRSRDSFRGMFEPNPDLHPRLNTEVILCNT
ncbi:MAG: hypothetical protein AAB858_01340, partial [Patescibacteria group bacterium]